ncbi:MAG: hypothetical protein AAF211_18830 [Myxococcota bacterium]
MKGLSDGPLTLGDARVAMSVLGHPVDRLFALQHDPELRQRLQQSHEVDLSLVVKELQRGG